ncbi:MAG: hypothetical protein P4L76_15355 [Beijerinckiaceae bacterium]|nr:hypothetical protein [Beijerinckiaceae bacterium]
MFILEIVGQSSSRDATVIDDIAYAGSFIHGLAGTVPSIITNTEWGIGIGIVLGILVGINQVINNNEARKRALKMESDVAEMRRLMEEQTKAAPPDTPP